MSATKPKRKLSIIGIILSIVLGITALLASIGGFSHVAEQAHYSTVSGTIVALDVKNDGRKANTKNRCAPIVEFQVNGQTYKSGPDRYSVFGTTETCKFSVGDAIDISYDPSDPSKATMRDATFDWSLGIFGAIIALIFCVIIPVRMIKSRKEIIETS